RGRLWLAKNDGVVVCIDPGQTQVFRPEDGLPIVQRAREMAEDSSGAIWISYDNGQVFRIQEGRMRALGSAEGLPKDGICQLTTDAAGRLWFAKDGQVG